jgi:hypothetical protein
MPHGRAMALLTVTFPSWILGQARNYPRESGNSGASNSDDDGLLLAEEIATARRPE